jgi:DNA-binding phage protein
MSLGSSVGLAGRPPASASLAETIVYLMVARDPQQAAEVILGYLMGLSGARAGAIFGVGAAGPQLSVGLGIDQHALDWTAEAWRESATPLQQGRLSRSDDRFLVPVICQGRLRALVYMTAAQLDLDTIAELAAVIGDAAIRSARQLSPASSIDNYLAEAPSRAIERRRLVILLARYEENVARVARALGVTRTTVYKRLSSLGIPRERTSQGHAGSGPVGVPRGAPPEPADHGPLTGAEREA